MGHALPELAEVLSVGWDILAKLEAQAIRVSAANIQGQPIPAYAVPMLIHQNLPGQIDLTAQFTQLALGTLPSDQLQELTH